MAISSHLNELAAKHRQLERQIQEALAHPSTDTAELQRLKSEKLKIKDQLAKLRNTRH